MTRKADLDEGVILLPELLDWTVGEEPPLPPEYEAVLTGSRANSLKSA